MTIHEARKLVLVDQMEKTQKYYTRVQIAHMFGFKKVYPSIVTMLEELVEEDKIEVLRVPHWNGVYKYLYAAIIE